MALSSINSSIYQLTPYVSNGSNIMVILRQRKT